MTAPKKYMHIQGSYAMLDEILEQPMDVDSVGDAPPPVARLVTPPPSPRQEPPRPAIQHQISSPRPPLA
jgi:hypothetical protein